MNSAFNNLQDNEYDSYFDSRQNILRLINEQNEDNRQRQNILRWINEHNADNRQEDNRQEDYYNDDETDSEISTIIDYENAGNMLIRLLDLDMIYETHTETQHQPYQTHTEPTTTEIITYSQTTIQEHNTLENTENLLLR